MCLGIPGRVVEIVDDEQCLAKVDVAGVKRVVNMACVLEDAQTLSDLLGAWVLVHVGFAMSVIDEEEAQSTLQLLAELGELMAEQDAMRQGS